MADRYLVATGSILDPANLDGGVALAAGDTLRANGFTGTIDGETPSLDYISVNALAPATAGGVFQYAQGSILNADVSPPAGHIQTLVFPVGIAWAVLNGSVMGGSVGGGLVRLGVLKLGTGNLIVNGKSTGGSALGNSGDPSKSGIRIAAGRLDIMDVEGGSLSSVGTNAPFGVHRAGGEVYVHGTAKSGACPAIGGVVSNVFAGAVQEVAVVETVGAIPAIVGTGNASGGPSIVNDRIILNKATQVGFNYSNWKFAGTPQIDVVFNDDTTASLSTNPDSTIDPSDVLEGVQFDNNTQTGTLKIVDPVPLANLVGQYITPQVLSAVTTP